MTSSPVPRQGPGLRRRRPSAGTVVALVLAAVVVLVATAFTAAALLRAPAQALPWSGGGAGGAATPADAGATGEAGGELPSGTTVDSDLPGVTGLDPEVLGALRDAAAEAEADGVSLFVTSGWRSPALQERLLDEAVAEHGSRAEAARWVATPETSAHVRGEAVDVGWWAGAEWLSEHGARHGLCQVYGNEGWHFELVPDARDAGCPRMFHDPTEDPRMQP